MRTAIVMAALLLAGPVAAATSEGVIASLQAARVDSTGGTLHGQMAGFQLVADAVDSFALQAGWASAVLEQESGPIVANQTPYDQGLAPENRTYDTVVEGKGSLGPGYQLYVLALPDHPLPRLAASGPCTALVPSTRQTMEVPVYVEEAQSRHRESVAIDQTLAWDAPCAAEWTVQGTFLLTLWESGLTFGHAGGNATYQTGQVTTSSGPANVMQEHTDRQLFLAVHDGLLRIEAARPRAYWTTALLDVTEVHLDDATGIFPAAGHSPVRSRVDLRGDLRLDLEHGAQGIRVEATGRLDGASLNGTAITVSMADGHSLPVQVWLGALASAPAAWIAVTAWRRRPVQALARLERLSLANRDEAVARGARRLQNVPGLEHEATSLRIQALARLGLFDQALAETRSLPTMEAQLAAAYTHALAGDVARCSDALKVCSTIDRPWLQIALRDPVFMQALRHPALSWTHSPEGHA